MRRPLATAALLLGPIACSGNAGGVTPDELGGGTTVSVGSTTSSGGAGGSAPACTGPYCSDAANCGSQGHSCLGGACSAGACQPFALARNTFMANQMALDSSNIYVGFSTQYGGRSDCVGAPRIGSFSRTSGAATILVGCGPMPAGGDNTYSMTLANGSLWFNDLQDSFDVVRFAMYQVPTTGGAVTSLSNGNGSNSTAVDATSVYYSATIPIASGGGVSRVDLDGSNPTLLSPHFAKWIVADDTTVYFAEDPCQFGEGGEQCPSPPTLYAVPKVGGATTTVASPTPSPSYLTLRDGYLYWSQLNSESDVTRILRVAVSGGTPQLLATAGLTRGVAVDSNFVYWIAYSGGNDEAYTLFKAPVGGGETSVVVTGQGVPAALAVDDAAIVWSRSTLPAIDYAGEIWMLAK